MLNRRSRILTSAVTLGLILASIPWVVIAGQRALAGLYNAPALWVSPSFEPRRQFEVFQKQFDRPEAIIVSWDGCTVDDRRLVELAEALLSDEPALEGFTYRELFPNVFTGYTAVRSLMDEPLELSRERALARLAGTLVGRDGRTSCAMVIVSREGTLLRARLLEVLLERAEAAVGVTQDQFFLSGSLIEGVAIDAESMRSGAYAVPSAVLSLALCLVCLRSITLAAPVFAIAAFGEGLVLATCYAVGWPMNAVLMVLAPLIFILTISAGVHLSNYYRDEVAYRGTEGAVERMLRSAVRPCALAAATTAIGLGSLTISDVVPVRQFGLLGAAGVLVTVTLLFLVLPGVLSWRSVRVPPATGKQESAWLHGLGRLIQRCAVPILLMTGILLCAGGWGLSRLTTSVGVLSLLDEESRLVHDYRWLEDHIGPLVPVELLVKFGDSVELDEVQRLEIVARVHAAASRIEGIGGTLSAATFLPPIPRSGGIRGTIRRTVYNKRLERELPELRRAGYLAGDDSGQTWRVISRTSALINDDYSEVLDLLATRIDRLLAELKQDGHIDLDVTYTGIMPLVQAGQEVLLRDLIHSFLTAFLVVGAIMILTLRSLAGGVMAMLPNVFPVVVLFGAMGWLRQPVDIGTMMTASIALGIAVDDTLHFLIWYQRSRGQQQPPQTAMLGALQHCGRAMLHTTIICSLGLMVYTLSGFVPTQRFALMMFALLAAALVGDLIVLPALLVGPLKQLFGQQAQPRQTSEALVS